DVDLWLVDLATKKRTQLTPDAATAGKASVREASFSGDGKSVYLVTDRGSEFNQLFRLDLARPDAPWRPLTADLRWNVERLAVARDGTVPFATNEDGYSKLYLLKSGSARRAVPLPAGVLGTMSFPTRTSDVLTFSIDTPTSPRDVWQLTLRTGNLV